MTERDIFLALLDLPDAASRSAYLDTACAGDAALRAQVEALLRSHDTAGNFLDPGDALPFLAPSPEPGSLGRLDHYEVLEVVGKGGMGVVVRARDSKLLRVVAIKALALPLAASGAARQRFVREARAAAAVRDEHLIDIHAVCDDGPVPYLVMEFIDGVLPPIMLAA